MEFPSAGHLRECTIPTSIYLHLHNVFGFSVNLFIPFFWIRHVKNTFDSTVVQRFGLTQGWTEEVLVVEGHGELVYNRRAVIVIHSQWLSFSFLVFVCFAGVYTAYKPYLNKDEEIIKQLQKVRRRLLLISYTGFPRSSNSPSGSCYIFWLNEGTSDEDKLWRCPSFFVPWFSGCSTKETLSGPECNSSTLLPGTDSELHHSTGNNN